MADPMKFWLNVANLVLGIVVLACVGAVLFCIVRELAGRAQRYRAVSRELNADMKRWFGSRHPDVPHRKH